MPGRLTGSYDMCVSESVTAFRIFISISSLLSDMRMRDLGFAADFDIFCVGSRSESIRLAAGVDIVSGNGNTEEENRWLKT